MEPAESIDMAFAQADMLDIAARQSLGIPPRTSEHPRISAYLDGDRGELEEAAVGMVNLWDLDEAPNDR